VRSEVSHLQHATASAAVICGRGGSNWANVSRRLKAAAHLEGKLTRALSVRLFYKATTIAGGVVVALSKLTRLPLIQKQTSLQFRVFFIPAARRSHPFRAAVSAH
jgi:hypothetical protein